MPQCRSLWVVFPVLGVLFHCVPSREVSSPGESFGSALCALACWSSCSGSPRDRRARGRESMRSCLPGCSTTSSSRVSGHVSEGNICCDFFYLLFFCVSFSKVEECFKFSLEFGHLASQIFVFCTPSLLSCSDSKLCCSFIASTVLFLFGSF